MEYQRLVDELNQKAHENLQFRTEASQNLFAVAVMKEQMGLMKSEENALREEASKRVSDMESGAQNLRNRLDQEEFARSETMSRLHATCCFLLFMVNWVKFVNDSNSKKKSKLAASKHGNRRLKQPDGKLT
ncbi:unnamed protein product [Symbiodinium microadriaticum]|nr:unnamed protein product [Symbiodinium microadriaticum]